MDDLIDGQSGLAAAGPQSMQDGQFHGRSEIGPYGDVSRDRRTQFPARSGVDRLYWKRSQTIDRIGSRLLVWL